MRRLVTTYTFFSPPHTNNDNNGGSVHVSIFFREGRRSREKKMTFGLEEQVVRKIRKKRKTSSQQKVTKSLMEKELHLFAWVSAPFIHASLASQNLYITCDYPSSQLGFWKKKERFLFFTGFIFVGAFITI